MAKLHELLAAEKTKKAPWGEISAETLKKFKNAEGFFNGHSTSLAMIGDSPENTATEAQARDEKQVVTTVVDTLEYALDIFGKSEDLQFQKNLTNRKATATIMWRGQILIDDVPVDELLGLESRLGELRKIFDAIPTLDATKHWELDSQSGRNIWVIKFPEQKMKTEKRIEPIQLSPATDKHPANVTTATRDVPVGTFTTIKRSGAATALQKAEAIKTIDELLVEVKQARMRANETEVQQQSISGVLVPLLLKPLRENQEV